MSRRQNQGAAPPQQQQQGGGGRGGSGQSLKMEFVYGYHGARCRNNMFLSHTGELVYHTAAVGIVYNPRNHSQRHMVGHDDDIISLAVSGNRRFVATGQVASQTTKKPTIHVWDPDKMQTVSILQGFHKRGVCALAFSPNSEVIASVGLDDNNSLALYQWGKGLLLADARGHSDRIFDIAFAPNADGKALVTCGVKHVKFWDFQGAGLKGSNGSFGKAPIQTMLCVAYSARGDCFTGALSGDVYQWNSGSCIQVIAKAHEGPAYAITSNPNRGFVTAGKDGKLRIWDTQFNPVKTHDISRTTMSDGAPPCARAIEWLPENQIIYLGCATSDILMIQEKDSSVATLITGHSEGEAWALATHPESAMFATASDDKTVRVWDMQTRKPIAVQNIGRAVRSIDYSHDGRLLALGLGSGGFMVLDAMSLQEVFKAKDRKEAIHEIKFSPDDRRLAVGSHDNFVDVYDVSAGYKRVGVAKGHSSYITHLDWTKDGRFFRTNSGDYETLFWDNNGKRQTAALKGAVWHTNTCVLEKDIKGIWYKGADKTDINTTDRTHAGQHLATGEDTGLVKLFEYPCPEPGARFKAFRGHSEHVCQVRFSKDDTRLITIGGGDQTVIQWRFTDALGGTTEEDTDRSDSNPDADIIKEISRPPQGKPEKPASRGIAIGGPDAGGAGVPGTRAIGGGHVGGAPSNAVPEAATEGRATQVRSVRVPPPKEFSAKPKEELQLVHVHGYRGYDARDNLIFNNQGCIVYPAAGVGVVTDPAKNTQRFFMQHTDDIIAATNHPDGALIATGEVGKKPVIHIWDSRDCSSKAILKGFHERGIAALAFSLNDQGRHLASVGLDDKHTMVISKWERGEKLYTVETSNGDKVFGVEFNPNDAMQICTFGVKHIKFWTVLGNTLKGQKATFGKGSNVDTVLSGAFTRNGAFIAGGASGSVYIFANGGCVNTFPNIHAGSCYALNIFGNVVVTGGKDGTVKTWTDDFKPINTFRVANASIMGSPEAEGKEAVAVRTVFMSPDGKRIAAGLADGDIAMVTPDAPPDRQVGIICNAHSEGELWGLATHPGRQVFATCSDDNTVRIWDAQNRRMLRARDLGVDLRSCAYSPRGDTLVVGTKNGAVYVLNADTLGDLHYWKHRKEEISDIKFNPKDQDLLAVANHDNFVDLYRATGKEFKRVGICKGNSSFITHIDWDEAGTYLQTNSGAYELLYYDATGKQNTRSKGMEGKKWASWTSVLGTNVAGIWPRGSDKTDINAVDLSHNGAVLATADDFGDIKLFTYPIATKGAQGRVYTGHSSHVTCCRFTANDEFLISTGGNDTAIFQWRYGAGLKTDAHPSDSEHDTFECKDPELANDLREDFKPKVSIGKANAAKPVASRAIGGPLPFNPAAPANLGGNVNQGVGSASTAAAAGGPARTQAGASPALAGANAPKVDAGGRRVEILPAGEGTPKTLKADAARYAPAQGVTDAPRDSLQLDFVHGFRCFDSTNNIVYTNDNYLIYAAANVGIVYDPSKHAQSYFMGHNDDIISVCLHPDDDLVATGQIGELPKVCVWSRSSLKMVAEFEGHHHVGISALSFCDSNTGKNNRSAEGRYLATAGMDPDHHLILYDFGKNKLIAEAPTGPNKILDIEYNKYNGEIVTVGANHLMFWNLKGNALVGVNGVYGKIGQNQPQLAVAFSSQFTYTGTASGHIYEWKDHILQRTIPAHEGPLNTLQPLGKPGSGFVSGGKDGKVRTWSETMAPLKTYEIPVRPGVVGSGAICSVTSNITSDEIIVATRRSEVYRLQRDGKLQLLVQGHCLGDIVPGPQTVAYGELHGLDVHPDPTKPIFATCSEDSTVRLWDIPTRKLLKFRALPSAARCVSFSPEGAALVVGLVDGSFFVLDASLQTIVDRKQQATEITCARFAPTKTHLAVSCAAGIIDVYRVSDWSRVGQFGTFNPNLSIIHFDWDRTGQFISADIEDGTQQFFDAMSAVPLPVSDKLRNSDWATMSCLYSANMAGLWNTQEMQRLGIDFQFVNACSVSRSGRMVATGDDMGRVSLLKYPAKTATTQRSDFTGHSACVMNVAFSMDDKYLISVGGEDMCVFQWRVVSGAGPEPTLNTNAAYSNYANNNAGPQGSFTPDERPGGRNQYVATKLNQQYDNSPMQQQQQPPMQQYGNNNPIPYNNNNNNYGGGGGGGGGYGGYGQQPMPQQQYGGNYGNNNNNNQFNNNNNFQGGGGGGGGYNNPNNNNTRYDDSYNNNNFNNTNPYEDSGNKRTNSPGPSRPAKQSSAAPSNVQQTDYNRNRPNSRK